MVRSVLAEGGRAGGAALGAAIMPSAIPALSAAGYKLGRRISKLVGSGDYEVQTARVNSLTKSGAIPADSTFGSPEHGIRVTHREFIGDVKTGPVAGTFYNTTYSVNPADYRTFPYLSCLAGPYEKFLPLGMAFEFISSTSAYNANAAMGTVVMSAAYNAAAAAFTSKMSMENSAYAISSRMDKNMVYLVECGAQSIPLNRYFLRRDGIDQPITMTDPLLFQVATAPSSTFPTDTVIGELWVTYDVWLESPRQCEDVFGLFTLSRNGVADTDFCGNGGQTFTEIGYGNLKSVKAYPSTDSTYPNQIRITDIAPGSAFELSFMYETNASDTAALTAAAFTITSGAVALNRYNNNAGSSRVIAVTGTGGASRGAMQIQQAFIATSSTVVLTKSCILSGLATGKMDLQITSLGVRDLGSLTGDHIYSMPLSVGSFSPLMFSPSPPSAAGDISDSDEITPEQYIRVARALERAHISVS